MRRLAGIARFGLVGLLVVSCGTDHRDLTPSELASQATPEASEVGLDELLGPWRPRGVPVPGDIVAAVRDACLEAGTPPYSFGLSDQPVVVADARGLGIVTVVLADDMSAFACRARLTGTGAAADAPARLDPATTGQPDEDGIAVVSHARLDDEAPASAVVGRVGPKAALVIVGFGDQTEVEATEGSGWFLAWWPGPDRPTSIVSTDAQRVALDGIEDPGREVEGRVAPASWWIDPGSVPVPPASRDIKAVINEEACASGQSPEGRVLDPMIFSGKDAVLVTFLVRRRPGGQDCQANPKFPFEFTLPEPLGDRKLLDGSTIPPRDATVPAE